MKNNIFRKLLALLLALMTLMSMNPALAKSKTITLNAADYPVSKNEWYDTMEEVAVYLATYDDLPHNFITKKEAQQLGWVSSEGNLWDVTDEMSIGGDKFGNYEGLLPKKNGRQWYECDVNYRGGYRGSERILYSNDGLIYYTDDHYESFTQLY